MPASHDRIGRVADLYGESRKDARTRLDGYAADVNGETPGDRLSAIEAKVDALIERMDDLERLDQERQVREVARRLGRKLPWPFGHVRLF